MHYKGKLKEWFDDEGYGFIQPAGGGKTLFVHITAFPRNTDRPKVGDQLTFEIVDGKDGTAAADNVEYLGRPQSPVRNQSVRSSVRPAARKSQFPIRNYMALFLTCLVLIAVFGFNAPMWILSAYLLVGAFSFITYGWDKRMSVRGSWRISEITLHVTDFLFGIVGGLLAQQTFSHKTRKTSFFVVTYVIFALHTAALLAFILGYGDYVMQLVAGI